MISLNFEMEEKTKIAVLFLMKNLSSQILIVTNALSFYRSKTILVGPIRFVGQSKPFWTGPKNFGAAQNTKHKKLDPPKTNWTDQNRFVPLEGQGASLSFIYFP